MASTKSSALGPGFIPVTKPAGKCKNLFATVPNRD